MDTPIDIEAVNGFRQILGMVETDTLPAELVEMYRVYRKRKDIGSAGGVSAAEYVILVTIYEAKNGDIMPPKKKTKKMEFPIKEGDKVASLFNGTKIEGEFIKLLPEPGLCAVKIPGDNMAFRKLKIEDTKLVSES